jgi:hypothetical protein
MRVSGRQPGPDAMLGQFWPCRKPLGNTSENNMGVRMWPVIVIRGDPLQWPGQVSFHLAHELFNKGGALVT